MMNSEISSLNPNAKEFIPCKKSKLRKEAPEFIPNINYVKNIIQKLPFIIDNFVIDKNNCIRLEKQIQLDCNFKCFLVLIFDGLWHIKSNTYKNIDYYDEWLSTYRLNNIDKDIFLLIINNYFSNLF